MSDDDAPEAQSQLSSIRQVAHTLHECINRRMRDLRAARHSLRWDQVALSALARGVLLRLRQEDPQHPVDWSVEEGIRVSGERRELEEVLEGVLTRAWQLTRDSEEPEIDVASRLEADGLGEQASAPPHPVNPRPLRCGGRHREQSDRRVSDLDVF